MQRRKTHEVRVGNIGIGGDNPVRVQSMCTTSTMDTNGCVQQILAIAKADAGAWSPQSLFHRGMRWGIVAIYAAMARAAARRGRGLRGNA